MKAWPMLVAVVASALGVALVFAVFPKSPPTPGFVNPRKDHQELAARLKEHADSLHQLETQVTQMSNELSHLKGEVRVLRTELQGAARASGERDLAESWPKSENDGSGEERLSDFDIAEEKMAMARELENQARLERHAAIHEREAVNPQWAQEKTEKITEAFREAKLPTSQITNIDCRASRCRVVVLHADKAAYQAFQQALTTSSGVRSVLPRAAFSHFELEDGGVESVMFLYQNSLRSAF